MAWPDEEFVDFVDRTLKRFTFHGAIQLLDPYTEVASDDHEIVQVRIRITVPDRDTGEPRHIWFTHFVTATRFRGFLQEWLTLALRNLWMHEFQEGLQFDGVRVSDPHRTGFDHDR